MRRANAQRPRRAPHGARGLKCGRGASSGRSVNGRAPHGARGLKYVYGVGNILQICKNAARCISAPGGIASTRICTGTTAITGSLRLKLSLAMPIVPDFPHTVNHSLFSACQICISFRAVIFIVVVSMMRMRALSRPAWGAWIEMFSCAKYLFCS